MFIIFDNTMKILGHKTSNKDYMFNKHNFKNLPITVLYVNDTIVTLNDDDDEFQILSDQLALKFDIKYLKLLI